ncbi:MAG: hypothetical protein KIS91_05820 [Anaerolineae bacterium]|nr:hypothetical protein [Anaerolineae bacterium]
MTERKPRPRSRKPGKGLVAARTALAALSVGLTIGGCGLLASTNSEAAQAVDTPTAAVVALVDSAPTVATTTAQPTPATTATTADGYTVRLTAGASRAGAAGETSFAVTRDGRPVTVEPYLGAQGHLVALREGDLAFLHVHPHEERLAFETTFPTGGRYRLFLQFKAAGTVHTAAFTRTVGA